jgi:hypothetical protein
MSRSVGAGNRSSAFENYYKGRAFRGLLERMFFSGSLGGSCQRGVCVLFLEMTIFVPSG